MLTFDTSGSRCGIALWRTTQILWLETDGALRHNEVLLRQCQQLLEEHSITSSDLKAIAVTAGPGSFTGLRVGFATAKGLCWAWKLPLIAIPTMEALACSVPSYADWVLTLMPARADEVYWSLFKSESSGWLQVNAEAYCHLAQLDTQVAGISGKVFPCGEGYKLYQAEIQKMLGERLCAYPEMGDVDPLVVSAAKLAGKRFLKGEWDDLVRAEPRYCQSFPSQSNNAAVSRP